jgi:LemA protein
LVALAIVMAPWVTIGLAVVAGLVVLWFVFTYNRIIKLENRIDNAWAQIDVQLKRRAELIPNLVNTVEGYKDFEQEVLENVTKARTMLVEASGRQESMEAEGMLEQALGRLFAVAEDYPELKANENFLQLQDELSHTENKIAFARQAYNDAVLNFNNKVETLPAAIVANMMGRSEREMLETPEEQRDVPEVSFE